MRDDHPAEQVRAIIAELDATPPRPPAQPAPPTPPAPVVVAPPRPPERFNWAALLRGLRPILLFAVVVALLIVLYIKTH